MRMSALTQTSRILSEGIEQELHSGAQLYVSLRGETVANIALGEMSPGQPMTTETILPWLSSGKPLAAIAIGQLVAKGKLHWYDKVCDHMPSFAENDKEQISIRHLLTHTGGFRGADRCNGGSSWSQIIECICASAKEADWEPGAKAGYHIHGSWFILGELIQRTDGRNYETYIQEEVFAPLGIQVASFALPLELAQAKQEMLGRLYPSNRTVANPHHETDVIQAATFCRPGSSARGPVSALAAVYESLSGFGRQRLVPPEIGQELVARHRQGMFDETFRHVLDWGLGFRLYTPSSGALIAPYGYGRHASPETFGHSGAQSSAGFADPKHGLVVAWVCNGTPGERVHQQRTHALNSAVYEDLGLGEV